MTINVAINGYGRIGRNILRALYENHYRADMRIVAINDTSEVATNAHLTQYDSTHGKFSGEVNVEGQTLIINGDRICMTKERDPSRLPWQTHNIDIVYECTGVFTTKAKASAHLTAGAKKVLISAPGGADVDATIVYGVNQAMLKPEHTVVSNASCTTNCLAPLVKVLHEKVGISQGLMTTIHAYTNDQVLVDRAHSDLRRARAAAHSMIPTKTGAANTIGLVLPALSGRLEGLAVRVPTMNVSLVDLTFMAEQSVTVNEIHAWMRAAANQSMAGILAYNDLPLVSIDFNHHTASAIYDASQTKVTGNLVKVLAWYDNEWGFSNRMLDVTRAWFR